MIIVRCLFFMLSAICFYGSDALAADFAAPFTSHNFFTTDLKPSSDAFKLAKSTWLPDSFDDLGLSGYSNIKYGVSQDSCSGYPLKTCPSNGKCTKCPVGDRWKLESCDTGYTLSGNSCTKKREFCVEDATTFKASIPADYYCGDELNNPLCNSSTLHNCEKCYKSCYKVNCGSYPLDCNSINKAALHIAETETCPNCKLPHSNCLKTYCKITKCADGYKMNAAGTACVEKDDICPNGYYKSCETGTQGDPQYTEKGTACYQCKPKTEDKPKRECKSSPGDVCIYTDDNGNFCIGSECSEEEYPKEKDFMKPSCVTAPTYGQWCSKRSCSDDNPLCYDLLDCSEHISPQCTTTNVWNITTETCSYYDEQGWDASCKIAGDYSAYECPTGQKCLFTYTDDGYYYSGRCVDASITEADIQKAIVDITKAACPSYDRSADSKKVVFYLGSDNNLSDLFQSLDRLKNWEGKTLSGAGNYSSATACNKDQSPFNQCVSDKVLDNNVKLGKCLVPTVFDRSTNRSVKIACEISFSTYIPTFCKMDYCAIDLEKINEYSLDDRTKEILDTYVLHELKQTLIWADPTYNYQADVYTIHEDWKSVSFSMSGPAKDFALSDYLIGCGACTKHIKAMEISNMTSDNPDQNKFVHLECYSLFSYTNLGCSNKNTEYSFIFRMLYNPDTISYYNGTANEARCHNAIGNGDEICQLENRYF